MNKINLLMSVIFSLILAHAASATCPEIRLNGDEAYVKAINQSGIVAQLNELNKGREAPNCYDLIGNNAGFFSIANSQKLFYSDIKLPKVIRTANLKGVVYPLNFRNTDGTISVRFRKKTRVEEYLGKHLAMSILVSNRTPHEPGALSKMARDRNIAFAAHQTLCTNIPAILKAGQLQSGQAVQKTNPDFTSEYVRELKTPFLTQVFLQLVAHNQLADELKIEPSKCILYFSLNVLDNMAGWHLTKGYEYGKMGFDSANHSNHVNLASLLDKISNYGDINPSWGVAKNEVVLPDSVPLNFLEYIAVPQTETELIKSLIETHGLTQKQ